MKVETQILNKFVNNTSTLPELKQEIISITHAYFTATIGHPLYEQLDFTQLCYQFYHELDTDLYDRLNIQFYEPLWKHRDMLAFYSLCDSLSAQIHGDLINQFTPFESQIGIRLWFPLCNELTRPLNAAHASRLIIDTMIARGCLIDFCTSVLNCTINQSAWELLKLLVKECGYILAYEKICIVCDRPTKISFDNQNRLHAEGEPAFELADGYSVYAHHGVILPEKYGKLHPNRWYSGWILKQKNAELRRLLIQVIGYERIARELKATELDTWREYTLLKINKKVDGQFIYLLKMTCPSTGKIHALRVPPDMQSAREAIRWVNWGIAPEEFSVQT